ncbi:MAG: sigma-70 family RNA polymerase sigma factor [Balneola sp.]
MNNSGNEKKIIKKALTGHQSAFKALYEQHVDELYCFLSQFAENTSQKEEWTQRAFIKAFNNLDQFNHKSSFKTWLFTIGLNEMRTDMRKKIHFENIDDKQIDLVDSEPVEETSIWYKAKAAIRQLAPDKRVICLLHIAEDYSHAEIAEMIGITEGTSRVILHRAKQELRIMVSK